MFSSRGAPPIPPWRKVNQTPVYESNKRRKISETNDEVTSPKKSELQMRPVPESIPLGSVSPKNMVAAPTILATPPQSPPAKDTKMVGNTTMDVNLSIEEEIDAWWDAAMNEIEIKTLPTPKNLPPSTPKSSKKFSLKLDKPSPSSSPALKQVSSPEVMCTPSLQPSPAPKPPPLQRPLLLEPVQKRSLPEKPPQIIQKDQPEIFLIDDDDDFEPVVKPTTTPTPPSTPTRAASSISTPSKKVISSPSTPRRNSVKSPPKRVVPAKADQDGWISKKTDQDAAEIAALLSKKRKPKSSSSLLDEGNKLESENSNVDTWLTKYKSQLNPPREECGLVDQFSLELIMGWTQPEIDAWRSRRDNLELYCTYFASLGASSSTRPNSARARTSEWSAIEARVFFQRLDEFLRNCWSLENWGFFSTTIPWRSGQQCREFYERLRGAKILDEALFNPPATFQELPTPSLPWESSDYLEFEQRVCSDVKTAFGLDTHHQLVSSMADSVVRKDTSAPEPPTILQQQPSISISKPPKPQKTLQSRRSASLSNSGKVQATLSLFIPGLKSTPKLLKPTSSNTISGGNQPLDYENLVIPKTIPANMCRKVEPFSLDSSDKDTEKILGSRYISCHLEQIPWKEIESRGPFQGVLMDPPWNELTCARLMEYVQITHTLMPVGFIFIWVDKEYIAKALKVLKRWKFEYVENMVWVQQLANNKTQTEFYPVFNRSKCSLLICRRGKGGIELRHQRSPDVWFEPVSGLKYDEGGFRIDKPEFVYQMIETLLPEAHYTEKNRRGGFLELWAPRNGQRRSWTSLCASGNIVPLLNVRILTQLCPDFEPRSDLDEAAQLFSQHGSSQIEIIEEVLASTQLAPVMEGNIDDDDEIEQSESADEIMAEQEDPQRQWTNLDDDDDFLFE